ncbi:MAG TPA: BatD family protein, partial [Candidatus Saccharimonadales bacterium]|nr:BatD family protein [Candidatus Saccharimonadales bacterium]
MSARRGLPGAPWLVALALAAGAGSAGAEEATLQASVDRNVAAVGEQITYTLTLNGGQGGSSPRLPQLPNFVVYAAGTSRNISFVNGKFSASAAFNFVLVPKEPGK